MAASRDQSFFEKELFKHTQKRNYDEVKRLITVENVYVDCVDEDGMTPLQHAAYKGSYKLCKLLLDCGANVNLTKHVSQYSALMFAALSAKVDLVYLLLEYGASTTAVNSINKTPAQMAAFVGYHHIVSVINNFIPIEEIEYFTKIQGLEREPRLPLALTPIVHKMAVMTNINPVRLAMYIQNNPCLLEKAKKVIRVFNALSEKYYFEKVNELLSLKFHHLAYVLIACEKYYFEKAKEKEPIKESLNPLIKQLIRGDINGFPVTLEKFLRQDIKEYPFVRCSLFQELVRTLAPVEIGHEPSAISIIGEAVNGKRGVDNSSCCATCGDPNAEKKCSVCKSVQYCDKECQKLHWFTHKKMCSTHIDALCEGVQNLNSDCVKDDDISTSDLPSCSHNP
ncbi:ankyrin repeat and MYND domain-containing protein 2 [Caerostris extrusa]|uniref:Ankyrin repeat and MYND domain-containing protein 2 n=1 Tax=Caerostris extrusa TaxID=172846 RepID=A0AAV4RSY9_CAEEX|nr:ankyrin repeat and MYND domain-containing protein 2 [Caerostris extrusa]